MFSAYPTTFAPPSGETDICELGVFQSHCFLLFLLNIRFQIGGVILGDIQCRIGRLKGGGRLISKKGKNSGGDETSNLRSDVCRRPILKNL